MATATTARIRRVIRATEFAVAQAPGILAARPDAKPQGGDDYTIDSFFRSTSVAQALLTEKFNVLSSNRSSEAAEAAEPMSIGIDVPIVPVLPRVQMIDATRSINKPMTMKGIAVDMQVERNAVDTVG